MNISLTQRLALGWPRLASAILTAVCLSGSADAEPLVTNTPAIAAPCYGGVNDAPPAVKSLTVVLVDLTAPKQGLVAWRDFTAAVQASFKSTEQRVVLLPFAGLGPGQTLARALDAVLEPPVTEEARQDMVIADFKRLQSCVGRRQTQIQQAMLSRLKQLAQVDATPLERSEILYALEATLSEFASSAQPLRLFVYSDGLQNGSGLNFYAQGAPRAIQSERELQRWKTAASAASKHSNVRVFWWGLLAQGEASPKGSTAASSARYLDAQTFASYRRFWSEALFHLGASKVDIGPTLNNPNLSFSTPGR